MEKTFYLNTQNDTEATLKEINGFIGENGRVVSVTLNSVSTVDNTMPCRGGWLVVAANS